MGVTTIFDFSTPSNYTFANVGVSALAAKLLRNQVSSPLTKTSNFGTPSDYGYDNTKIVIASNQAKLIATPPTGGCTFFGSFASSINGDFGAGTVTATQSANVTPAGGYIQVASNGKVVWGSVSPLGIVQTGCVRVTVQPQYSGSPTDYQIFVGSDHDGTNHNLIQIYHDPSSGNLVADVHDASGTQIALIGAVWNPISGTVYELELDFDVTSGNIYLFINGVLFASATGATGTRDTTSDEIVTGLDSIGGVHLSAYWIKNLAVFPSVQHTSGFSSPVTNPVQNGYSVSSPSIGFVAQAISDMDLNAITNITAGISVSGGDTVSWNVSVNGGGSYLWWTGSVWASSSGVAQSNDLPTIVANLASLPLATQFELQAFLNSSNGSTTPTLSDVVVTYNELLYGTGTIQSNSGFTAQEIASFVASLSESGSDTVTFGLLVNGQLMYWNGTTWANSDGSFAETNTAAVLGANVSTLLSVNSTVKVFALLVSGDGTTTPSLTSMTVQYNFGAIEASAPPTCIVYGFIRDIEGNPVAGAVVKFSLVDSVPNGYMEGSDHVLMGSSVSVTSDVNGYFEQEVLVSSFQGSTTSIVMSITNSDGSVIENAGGNGKPLTLVVPNQQSVDVTTLIAA